jgi:LAS superfamily LD-carboxypeptidase LdcB
MPGNALTSLELTGRAMTHVVTLRDPSCTLHAAVVEPFLRLRAAAASDGIDLAPVSTFRDFSRQLAIWNAKCRGERELFDRDGVRLDYASLGEAEVVSAILHWSALPGASRHHWGTEIDVVDAGTGEPGRPPQLLPGEYAPGGRQARLGEWLDLNVHRFGFHRPYATDRGGVQPEPWHLSHTETASAAMSRFTPALLLEALEGVDLGNAGIVRAKLPEIYERYVMNVDPPPVGARGDVSPGTRLS